MLKSICVEFDLHKVVITWSYFTEIQSFIYFLVTSIICCRADKPTS